MAETNVPSNQPDPGQVITPGTGAPTAPLEPSTPETLTTPAANVSTPETSSSDLPVATQSATAAAGYELDPDQKSGSKEPISWTASEFVAHEKSASWYLGLWAAAIGLAIIIYLLTKDFISSVVVIVAAGFFGLSASRKPKAQQYSIDASGVTIGQKRYGYDEFRSFAVVPEGAFASIVFKPLKRFGTLTSIYYAPENEDEIVNILSDSLPFEEHRQDAVDNLLRRIRF